MPAGPRTSAFGAPDISPCRLRGPSRMCVPALPLLDDRKSIDHTRRRGRLGGVQRDRKPYSPFFRAPEPMPPLKRSDLDQAVRYLQHARELLEREPGARMRVIREVLRLAMRRLSPGDFYAGDGGGDHGATR